MKGRHPTEACKPVRNASPDRDLLIVRADGGGEIGGGHLGRCLALAQAWLDSGGRVELVSAAAPAGWIGWYRDEGVAIGQLRSWPKVGDAWVVLDGYQFDGSVQQAVKAAGHRLLVIADHGSNDTHYADLVLDQNLGSSVTKYAPHLPDTRLLLGTEFALVRREFREMRPTRRRARTVATQLLVMLGSSPSPTLQESVRATLEEPELAGLEVTVLGGHDDPAPHMASADLALSTAGTTVWELCCMGVPAVLVSVAPNQEPVARAVAEHGAAIDAGPTDSTSPQRLARALADLAGDSRARASMTVRAQALVDGLGPTRVVAALRSKPRVQAAVLR